MVGTAKREALLHRIQQTLLRAGDVRPDLGLCVPPRVEESGLGLVADYGFSALART
jgi:hypothetical protein